MDKIVIWTCARLPLGLGLALWSISGSMTIALFWYFAGDSWPKQVIAVGWAVALEGTKIYCWKRGGWLKLLSGALVCLTLFSAWSIAVASVDAAHQATDQHRSSLQERALSEQKDQASVQAQIDILVERLRVLPPDFVTGAAQLNRELQSLRDRQRSLRALDGEPPDSLPTNEPNAFQVLALATGWTRENWVILVVLVIAVLTEASALALTSVVQKNTSLAEQPLGTPKIAPTAEDYLRVATDHPRAPRLLGRLEVARRLGIGENQSRLLLEELIRMGRIKRGGKAFELSSVRRGGA
ncbi:MAG: hypothetical protein WCG80_06780 [Spirochaetales bacterium]